ncbi:MAG: hypothetical protein N2747_06030 [Chitinophagaceae bacterium]|nr:hypothetical protein [Chitinophagaceae bacterium]
MSHHEDKYITKLLFGFFLILSAVMLLLYVCFERAEKDEWYGWGMAISTLFCIGLFLIGSAFNHKMKSDLIRKQRMRMMQSKKTAEEEA